ncbi:MAG: CPBP family intramembrane glutamic endopeptidase [Xanthobacteraceae bacterium]
MSDRVGVPRAAWLLARLRLRRQLNQLDAIYRYRLGTPDRKATSRTSPTMWLISALVVLVMLGSFTHLASQCMNNMQDVLGSVHVGNNDDAPVPAGRSSLRSLPPESGSALSSGVFKGATLEVMLLLVTALLLSLAGREIARPDWDLEWLATLPLPLSTLIVSKLVERVVVNSYGFFTLVPFLSVVAWTCGYRWLAPLLAIGFTFLLMFLVATGQMLVDTGLRLALAPSKLKNVQAAISLVGLAPLLLAASTAMPGNGLVFGWAAALPEVMQWSPAALAVRALAAIDVRSAALWALMMLAQIGVLVAIGTALLKRQLRNGVVAAGSREGVARGPPAAQRRPWNLTGNAPSWLSTVQRRELRLLARDRTFMVQTLLLPAVIVGGQIFVTADSNFFADAVDHPSNLAAIAFALAAYTLMFSAFQTLNAEGQALWLLYCVPHSLDSILRQKAMLWATLATTYPLIIFAIAVATAGAISLQFLACAAVVLAGVPIFAVIATALGVFGCDPLAQDVQRRLRPTYLYLYMMVSSLYAYAIFASGLWERTALMILTALVAVALWQKARDQFDYLLDPAASPPPRVSVSDGLIAALLFFVLQAIVALAQMGRGQVLTASMAWLAFCSAGAVTYGLVRLIYWRARTADVPVMLGERTPQAVLWGALGGLAASAAAFAYIEVVRALDLFPVWRAAAFSDATTPLWLAAVAVIAAPIFEEFVFRGLVFRGLRRSFGPGMATLASAAIFAIVHPPISVIPVFIMGVGAALVYQRAGMLLAPIVLHAVYNATVLGFQWKLMG